MSLNINPNYFVFFFLVLSSFYFFLLTNLLLLLLLITFDCTLFFIVLCFIFFYLNCFNDLCNQAKKIVKCLNTVAIKVYSNNLIFINDTFLFERNLINLNIVLTISSFNTVISTKFIFIRKRF